MATEKKNEKINKKKTHTHTIGIQANCSETWLVHHRARYNAAPNMKYYNYTFFFPFQLLLSSIPFYYFFPCSALLFLRYLFIVSCHRSPPIPFEFTWIFRFVVVCLFLITSNLGTSHLHNSTDDSIVIAIISLPVILSDSLYLHRFNWHWNRRCSTQAQEKMITKI